MSRAAGCCAVLELRQYTLVPGRRDTLVELFDRRFVESQEAVGAHIVGQFRDPDRPDVFVWLRGFRSMEQRAETLGAFYGGPVWRAHREAANATMVDSDNVLLLRPMWSNSGIAHPQPARPVAGVAATAPTTTWSIVAFPLRAAAGDELRESLRVLGDRAAVYETEPATNTFPALPVREGEHVVVVVTPMPMEDLTAAEPAALLAALAGPPQRMVLEPTARSELR